MYVYTYSEARQKLAQVLDQAQNTGQVIIRRRDGRSFALTPLNLTDSPLDVPSIQADVSTAELIDFIREGRARG